MALVEKEVKNVYLGSTKIRPTNTYVDYNFPAWTYPWWTLYSGSFWIWPDWDWWITAWVANTNCRINTAFPQTNRFIIQHRCKYNLTSWGWVMTCYVADANESNSTWIHYAAASSGTAGALWRINWVDDSSSHRIQLPSGYIYIDEIVYDGTDYTLNLYEDNNGEPWTLLYTYSVAWANNNTYLWLYHEHGTAPFSETNRVKLWYR